MQYEVVHHPATARMWIRSAYVQCPHNIFLLYISNRIPIMYYALVQDHIKEWLFEPPLMGWLHIGKGRKVFSHPNNRKTKIVLRTIISSAIEKLLASSYTQNIKSNYLPILKLSKELPHVHSSSHEDHHRSMWNSSEKSVSKLKGIWNLNIVLHTHPYLLWKCTQSKVWNFKYTMRI